MLVRHLTSLTRKAKLTDRLISSWLATVHPYLLPDFSNMTKMLAWLERHNHYDVYSFDVFDTLLRRRIDPPGLIKALAAEYLSTRLAQHEIHISPVVILAQRNRCEQLLLQQALSKGRDADYCLDDVMAGTLEAIKADSTVDSREIVKHEIGLEKKAAQAMPGAVEVLSYLKAIGKRVICISDSYLSVSQMSSILEYHGFLQYMGKLYVSSDVGKRKSTGRLFQYVIDKEDKKIVHIGDNYDSDYVIPKKLGLKAFWFHSNKEQRRKKELRELFDSENKMDYVSTIISSPVGYKSELQRVGYEVLGPALTVFVHNVAEQASNDKVEALFFLARDGYAMKKIYETLQCTIYVKSALPPGRYMCLGRLPVRLASLDGLSYQDILKVYGYVARFPGRNVSLKDILGSYGLEPDGLINIAKQCGLELNEPIIDPAQDERLRKFTGSNELQEIVRGKSAEARELLRNYLDSIGFMGKKKVAVVDANAEGLTQTILDMIFSDDTSYPSVIRYYFNLLSLNIDTAGVKPELTEALGIVSDWRSDSSSEHASFCLFGLLVELFCHPNHGVTVGYERVGSRTVPIFRNTPQEAQYDLTSQVLQGILAYAKDYGTYYGLHNYACTQLLEGMKNKIRQWVLRPPKADAAPLRNLSFTSDWPVETNHCLIKQVTVWDIVTIKGMRKKVGSSSWPQATLILAPASGFSTFLYRATNHLSKL